MDSLLVQRELGLPLGGRCGTRCGLEPIWGGHASGTLVKKLQLDHSLDQALCTAVNDISWDCSGCFLASAGDDCALHVYRPSGELLRSFDPVRTGRGLQLQLHLLRSASMQTVATQAVGFMRPAGTHVIDHGSAIPARITWRHTPLRWRRQECSCHQRGARRCETLQLPRGARQVPGSSGWLCDPQR